MTREELKRHCEKQVEECERWAKHKGEEPHGIIYEEHKLILDLLEQEPCEECSHNDGECCRVLFEESIKKEPSEDCVSRNVLKSLAYYIPDEEHGKRLVVDAKYIDKLPSVTPTQRWIPCSERLPKESEYVGDVCKYYLVQDEYGDMHVAHYEKIGWIPMHSLEALSDEVVAWMPLPKPYKKFV